MTFGSLLESLFGASRSGTAFSPRQFKSTIGRFNSAFSGYQQQDSQEFLAFLLDGLHEDLNRILKKPATEKPELKDENANDVRAIAELAEKSWENHKLRNESVVLDLFGGLYKSTLVCPQCNLTSVTFDPFMDLTLPLPSSQIWTKEIFVFPRTGQPVLLNVELSPTATGAHLKQYIARKLNVVADNLHLVELYQTSFYRNFQKLASVNEITSGEDSNDFLAAYEADFSLVDSDESPIIDEKPFLVPVYFQRNSSPSTTVRPVGIPFYVSLNASEASNPATISRKILEKCGQLSDHAEKAIKELSIHDIPFSLSYHSGNVDGDRPACDWRLYCNRLKRLNEPIDDEENGYGSNEANSSSASSRSIISVDEIPLAVKNSGAELDTPSVDTPSMEMEMEAQSVPPSIKVKTPSIELETPGTDIPTSEQTTPDVLADADESHVPFIGPIALSVSPLAHSPVISEMSDENNEYTNLTSMLEVDSHGPISMIDAPPRYDYKVASMNRLSDLDTLVCDWAPERYDEIFGEEEIAENISRFDDPELEEVRRKRLEKESQGITLDSCLDQFSRTEVLGEDDLWHCSRCNDFRRASKTIELWRIPDIFTIQLKRFSSYHGFRDKLSDVVNFPIEGLDMSKRIQKTMANGAIADTMENHGHIYDLFAVDNHYGGLGGGHYTAYAKNFVDEKWYYYDDSRVQEADPQDSVAGAAYLLFYRRRSKESLGGEGLKSILAQAREEIEKEEDIFECEMEANTVAPFPGEGRVLGNGGTSFPMPWDTPSLNLSEDESEEDDKKDMDFVPNRGGGMEVSPVDSECSISSI